MSRSLMFRAWNPVTKEMRYQVYPTNTDYCMYLAEDACWEHLGPVEVMQYIGNRDKNHKPIFEGDLIIIDGQYGPYPVEWSDSGFGFVSCAYQDEDSLGKYRSMEVVGNIYENPNWNDYEED